MDYWSDSNRYRSETHRYVRLTEIRYGSWAENEHREKELTGIGHGDFADFIGEGEQRRRSLIYIYIYIYFLLRFFLFYFNSKFIKKKKSKMTSFQVYLTAALTEL